MENDRFKAELMLSDIRDNSLTGMIKNKGRERWTLISVIYGIIMVLFLLFIYPLFTSLLNLDNFFSKTILFVIIAGISYYYTIEEFILERRKKDKKKMQMISSGGDMVSYFMKIKDFVRKDYTLPYRITVIEGASSQIIPVELTYHDYEDYARFIDGVVGEGLTFQEFELRGKITLFDKYRTLYKNFEGTTLIKMSESIFRENENTYQSSTSRRLYVLIYVPHSKDLQESLATVIAVSNCKMQFLTERMYKELSESYFNCPVNLEKMRARNVIRRVSLEETKIIGKFESEKELLDFLSLYKDNKYRNSFKYKIKRGQDR